MKLIKKFTDENLKSGDIILLEPETTYFIRLSSISEFYLYLPSRHKRVTIWLSLLGPVTPKIQFNIPVGFNKLGRLHSGMHYKLDLDYQGDGWYCDITEYDLIQVEELDTLDIASVSIKNVKNSTILQTTLVLDKIKYTSVPIGCELMIDIVAYLGDRVVPGSEMNFISLSDLTIEIPIPELVGGDKWYVTNVSLQNYPRAIDWQFDPTPITEPQDPIDGEILEEENSEEVNESDLREEDNQVEQ